MGNLNNFINNINIINTHVGHFKALLPCRRGWLTFFRHNNLLTKSPLIFQLYGFATKHLCFLIIREIKCHFFSVRFVIPNTTLEGDFQGQFNIFFHATPSDISVWSSSISRMEPTLDNVSIPCRMHKLKLMITLLCSLDQMMPTKIGYIRVI